MLLLNENTFFRSQTSLRFIKYGLQYHYKYDLLYFCYHKITYGLPGNLGLIFLIVQLLKSVSICFGQWKHFFRCWKDLWLIKLWQSAILPWTGTLKVRPSNYMKCMIQTVQTLTWRLEHVLYLYSCDPPLFQLLPSGSPRPGWMLQHIAISLPAPASTQPLHCIIATCNITRIIYTQHFSINSILLSILCTIAHSVGP